MALSTVTVTGTWIHPDQSVPTGKVTFAPVQDAPGGGYIVVEGAVTATLVNGSISQTLVNNAQVTALQYLVTEEIDGVPGYVNYVITPTGSTLDLSTAPRGTVGATTPVYVLASTLGQANGIAQLDAGGHVPIGQVPAIPESQVTNLTTDLAAKAPLASPAFTGTVEIGAADTTLYRSAASMLRTDATLILGTAATLKLGSAGNVNLYWNGANSLETDNGFAVGADLQHWGAHAGFFGTTAVAKPTVTGAKGGNAALASLLSALASLGLITDSTTA